MLKSLTHGHVARTAFAVIAMVVLACCMAGCGSGSSHNGTTNTAKSSSASAAAAQTGNNQNNQARSASAATPVQETLPEQPLPENGQVLDGESYGYSAVEVVASPNASSYVKVKTPDGATQAGFFVVAGSSAQVYVPEGTYDVQFASGEKWYGPEKRFGSGTSYGQDGGLVLEYGDVVTYTLTYSPSGNFSMAPLSGSQF